MEERGSSFSLKRDCVLNRIKGEHLILDFYTPYTYCKAAALISWMIDTSLVTLVPCSDKDKSTTASEIASKAAVAGSL